MRLHEARNAADIGRWLDDLDVRWPQRGTVTDHRSGKTIALRDYLRGQLEGLA